MKKIFLLFLVNMLLMPAFADQLVKQTKDTYVYPSDGTSWPFDLDCIASKISSVSVIIAPSSGDPGVQTANPISPKSGCPIYDSTGEGQPEHHFNLTFNSLRDLGTWQIQCVGHSVPPAACVSADYPPCNVRCDLAYVTEYTNNPLTFNVNVFNNAPTAILSHSPTPTWNNTVTLNSNATDPDGGSLNYTWSITNRPSTSGKNLSSINTANPTITFNNDDDIGDWTFSVFIDDNEGERKTFTHSFTVPNIPPNISVGGNTNIDALQAINLSATPTTDIDGGNLTFRWDILNAPARSPIGPQNNYSTASTINIPPTDAHIGAWQFRVTATDDEGDTDSETVNVTVNNLPPEIHFAGAHIIDVGETIQIETTISNDADGGQLDFVWDIIQAPQASTINVQSGFHSGSGAAGASISLPTGFNEAGTWIFRLTATDDDGQPDSKIEKEFTLLVDGPVDAKITGPATIGSLSFPLTLNGTDSVDPDSPCVGTIDRCHDTLDSRPVTVSPDVVRYTWYLADVPFELFSEYPLGRIDEVFGISASGSSITLDFGDLKPGDWVFELEVVDAEGNADRDSFLVSVIDESGPPFAILNPTRRYEVDLANNVSENVALNSDASFDSDNLISGGGVGIKQRQWNYVFSPTGCATPTLPSGINTSSFNLYNSGNTVSPSCQGYWGIGLTVTDDDIPAKTASTSTGVIIGSCPSLLCIDYPKTLKPAVVEFTDNADILIYYRLDSTLYDDLFFVYGMFTILEIYHESDLSTPVYTDFDPNVLATDKGSMLVFHWNGFTNPPLHLRPRSGRYSVRIKLANSLLAVSPAVEAVELDSIMIAVAEPEIEASSETMLRYEDIVAGSDTLQIDYVINGGASFDEFVWRVYDSSSTVIANGTSIGVSPGSINWDGISSGTPVSPGEYEFELEVMRAGASMDVSSRHPFKVYSLDLDVDTNRDGVIDATDETGEENWTKSLGAIFTVNYDRDGSRTAGGLPIPDTINFNDAGTPENEDLIIDNANDEQDISPLLIHGIGVDLPASYSVFLKAAELEDVESIHVFKRIAAGETAIWGALGSRIGGPAVPLEIDITQWVNPSSPNFVGVGPSGNAMFGIEGLFFRSQGLFLVNKFNGEIQLTLELRDGATVIASDQIKMKVAPWLMLPHTESSREVWTENNSRNAPLRETASNDAGYFGLDDSMQLHTESGVSAGSQWFQDHIEIGYYQRPGGPKVNEVFRLPYFRGPAVPQPTWPMHRLLKGNTVAPAHDIGTHQLGSNLGAVSGDYGGNLEIMPPTPTHPLGRILIGDTSSDGLVEFLQSQEVQSPVQLPTQWLMVSHIDEVIGFTGSGTNVIISDTLGAYALMNAIPAADRSRHVFFAEGAIPETGISTAPASANNRIETAGDYTGTTWNYIRIYSDAGSGAAGQAAHISGRGAGFLEIDKVWNIPQKIIPGGGVIAANTYERFTGNEAPHKATWYNNPDVGDKYVLVEQTRFWKESLNPGGHGTPAFITVEEVLADTDLKELNTLDIGNKINNFKSILNTAHGSPLTYISVPTIYFGDRIGFDTSRKSVAMTPGLSNFQRVNGILYFPRQFGPKDPATGNDLFEAAVLSVVPGAKFIDDWDWYHRLLGEVHCGSNVLRVPYALDWWSNQP